MRLGMLMTCLGKKDAQPPAILFDLREAPDEAVGVRRAASRFLLARIFQTLVTETSVADSVANFLLVILLKVRLHQQNFSVTITAEHRVSARNTYRV
jgi:hypothetical protein